MKQFIDSLIASVFFLILMLLGETLQFLPSGSSAFLTCVSVLSCSLFPGF